MWFSSALFVSNCPYYGKHLHLAADEEEDVVSVQFLLMSLWFSQSCDLAL